MSDTSNVANSLLYGKPITYENLPVSKEKISRNIGHTDDEKEKAYRKYFEVRRTFRDHQMQKWINEIEIMREIIAFVQRKQWEKFVKTSKNNLITNRRLLVKIHVIFIKFHCFNSKGIQQIMGVYCTRRPLRTIKVTRNALCYVKLAFPRRRGFTRGSLYVHLHSPQWFAPQDQYI